MYTVGSIIKNEREKHKISQEELCFGICAVSTLSRIEHNEQTPTMEKAMALLNRLGLEGSRYLSFVSEDEHEFYRINCDVEQMLALRSIRKLMNMSWRINNTWIKTSSESSSYAALRLSSCAMRTSSMKQQSR